MGLKIAFMGIRGIPKGYSGFETFVRELAPRLVERGHDVTVYGRSYHMEGAGDAYKGVRLVSLPTIRGKHLETIVHTTLSVLHGFFRGYDIVYFCIVGNAPVVFVPRLAGARVFLNVDGADWQREKWGGFARRYLKMCEWIAPRAADVIVADARVIQQKYERLYGARSLFIPYGANILRDEGTEELEKHGLKKGEYILFVSRLEPENRADLLIEAYKKVRTDKKLVIVGGAPYGREYIHSLKDAADERVIFTGGVFDKGYRQLSCGAYLFTLPSAVDGTRPALLDQLGFGNCVLVCGTPANSEVVADHGVTFGPDNPVESLAAQLQRLIDSPEVVARYRAGAARRIKESYSWEMVTDMNERAFYEAVGERR